jgi:hypothetical protein
MKMRVQELICGDLVPMFPRLARSVKLLSLLDCVNDTTAARRPRRVMMLLCLSGE